MENEYSIEEMIQNLKRINETTFWVERLSNRSFEEFKKLVKYHEQEMKRHEEEETAWSEALYEEEKKKRDNILLANDYQLLKTLEESIKTAISDSQK